MDPLARIAFDLIDCLCNRYRRRRSEKYMDVISYSIDEHFVRSYRSRNAGHISQNACANFGSQIWNSILCTEVEQDSSVGVAHVSPSGLVTKGNIL
jgi:hypothetical protein